MRRAVAAADDGMWKSRASQPTWAHDVVSRKRPVPVFVEFTSCHRDALRGWEGGGGDEKGRRTGSVVEVRAGTAVI